MYNYQSTKLKYTILQQKISSSPQTTTAISVCSCQYPSFLPENGLHFRYMHAAKSFLGMKGGVWVDHKP